MNASELMTKAVSTCFAEDNLEHAAQIMWEHDCGAVPVVDQAHHVVGMITDRDIAMAAYTQGRPLHDIPVSATMARRIYAVGEGDPLETVEAVMKRARIRRVPVLDGDGRLTGILSVSDLARHTHRASGRKGNGLSSDSVAQTLAAISEPGPAQSSAPS